MASYPSFMTLNDSTLTTQSGIDPARATNGRLALRRLWSADKSAFDIGHVLTAVQKTTLDSFYGTNKDLDVTYKWPPTGATYTVRFVDPPQYVPRGAIYETRVRLLEV
jgi:hypothetical protein